MTSFGQFTWKYYLVTNYWLLLQEINQFTFDLLVFFYLHYLITFQKYDGQPEYAIKQ